MYYIQTLTSVPAISAIHTCKAVCPYHAYYVPVTASVYQMFSYYIVLSTVLFRI